MKSIELIPYSDKLHLDILKKWLTNEKLMEGWGMPPFWDYKVAQWVNEQNKVVLMIKDIHINEIVGFVNFYEWNKEKGIAGLGYLIDPKYHNQGYGQASMTISNKYGFETLKLNRIELYIEGSNIVSKHIIENLKYTFDKYDSKKDRYYYSMERNKI